MRIAGFPCTSIIPEMLRNISIFKVFRHVLNQKQTLSKVLLEDKLHEVMKLAEIKPDDVYLKPALLTVSR